VFEISDTPIPQGVGKVAEYRNHRPM